MLWTKQEQAKEQRQEKEQEQKHTWPGKCTAKGAGRLEADEAEVGAGVVAEEADVAELG